MSDKHIQSWLLALVRRGYKSPTSHTINVDGTQIVVERHGQDVAICCVGSNERVDWARNFDARAVVAWEFPGQVHHGFLDAFSVARSFIDKELYPGDRIHIVGHSLGGALAPLVAYHLSRCKYDVRQVLTLGAPRVGDSDWQLDYDSRLGDRTRRVVNVGDLVPLVPPALVGYRHVGQAVYYSAGGTRLAQALALPQQWAYSIWAWIEHKLSWHWDFASDDYHDWELYLQRLEGEK